MKIELPTSRADFTTSRETLVLALPNQTPDDHGRVWFLAFWLEKSRSLRGQAFFADPEKWAQGNPQPVRWVAP